MKKSGVVFAFLFWFVSVGFSQSGNFYLSHYQPTIDNVDNQTYAIKQDTLGVMYAANRKGVLKFNGTNWELISTPFSVYSLDLQRTKNKFFVGGKNDFGYILRLPTGREIYHSLRDTIYTNIDFRQTVIWGEDVYFYGNGLLIKYSLSAQKVVQKWDKIDKKKITAFFTASNKIYIEVAERGIYLAEDGNFKRLYVQLPDKDAVLAAKGLSDESILTITQSGKLYQLYKNLFVPFATDELEYLERSQVLDAMILNDSLLMFSTLRGGCVVMNYKEGKIIQIVNYQTGLPDEEIFAIGQDKNNGAWIAHNYGFTRLDYGLPLRSYSQFGGLEGHILAAQPFQNVLYVATSTGVFYLDEIKQYQETTEKMTVVVKTLKRNNSSKKNVKTTDSKNTTPTNTSESTVNEPIKKTEEVKLVETKTEETVNYSTNPQAEENQVQEEKKAKKGFFSRIGSVFKKKEKKEESQKVEQAVTIAPTVIEETPAIENPKVEEVQVVSPNIATKTNASKPKYSFYKQSVEKKFVDLKSVRHLFKRVEGIEGKCEKFIVVGNSLLVSGNAGLFLIGDKKEEVAPVAPKKKWWQKVVVPKVQNKTETKTKNKKAIKISDEPIQYAIKAAKKNIVYATTDEGRLIVVNMKDKKSRNLVKFDDDVNRITEDSKGNVWVCGTNFIYQVDLRKSKPKVNPFPVDNEYTDQIIPLKIYNRNYFILSSIAYYFDEASKNLVKDSLMVSQMNKKAKFLSYDDQLLWTNYKNQWNLFGENQFNKENLAFFKLFDNIERIIHDADGKHLWLITQGGGLYKFDATTNAQFAQNYQLLTNFIKNKRGNFIPINHRFDLDFYNNSLTFSLITPDYLKSGMIEYQYLLEGNMKDWSEWTDDGNFVFPALNTGKYTLKVRSRNVFGTMVESDAYTFSVQPPYWQTFWFNALEVGFFLVLLFIAGLVNRKIQHENRFLAIGKRVVTMLTLVVCMEFMQTLLQGYIDINGSPVKDFVVEVVLALTLLPLEWILMKMITTRFKKRKIKSLKHDDEAIAGNVQTT
jgi:hypothetical protein